MTDRTALARFEQAMAMNDLALRMKNVGWGIDQATRAGHQVRLSAAIAEAKEKFLSLTGESLAEMRAEAVEDDDEFDEKLFNSAPRLKHLFFDKWEVVPKYFSKSTGAPSLNKNALKDLLAEGKTQQIKDAARMLLQFRENHKTLSTYVRKLDPANLNANGEPNTYLTTGDGLLHCTWNVVQAATGRWSSSDPNLQNIQKDVVGEKDPVTGKKKILRAGMRDMFIAHPGYTLVEGDYAQLELRIIALLAGDPILCEMFAQPGIDMHVENAKILFATKEPTKNERELAKTFVYGSNYGGSARTIWKQIVTKFPNLTEVDVLRMQERWFKAHPWIPAWTKAKVREAKETGKVIELLSGREFVFFMRQVKATEPGNFSVQGFAATLMNEAILKIDRALNWITNGGDEAVLSQVHDAGILMGKNEDRLGRILKESMETSMTIDGLTMKFPVDLKKGPRWGLMEEFKVAA